MITSICKQCPKEIVRRGKRVGQFCSVQCKADWQKTQKPVTKEWLEQKYLIEKLSTYDIADLVNRNPKRVYDWLIDYEIPTRPRGLNLAGKDNYMHQPNAINPFQDKQHTDETKRILSIKASVPKPWLRGKKNGMHGRNGKNNPNYIDGSSPERQRLYATSEWKELIRQVYKRDNYKCTRCKSTNKKGHRLHAHHIKSWAGHSELRFNLSNIITLCELCHNWVHSLANTEKKYLS